MKSIVIYYFTGTGNTELVANMMKDRFTELNCRITMLRIEDVLKDRQKIDISANDLIGIGCPVIGFTVPDIVMKFSKLLPANTGKKVFLFCTAGGVAPINYNASNRLTRNLRRKGFEVFHERIFSISSNWINRYENYIIRQLYSATEKKVSILCRQVLNEEERILRTKKFLAVRMELLAFVISKVIWLVGKDLRVNESCTGCGLCVENCPIGNISLKRGKIKFGHTCNSCMRCVYSCPQKAVNYRLLTFFPVKEGYNIKKILSRSYNQEGAAAGKEPQFFKEYIANDDL